MPYTADVVVAFLVTHGNKLLRQGVAVPYARQQQSFAQQVHFFRGDDAALSFDAWAAQGGVERLGIMVPARVHASRPRLHETKEVAKVLLRELGSNSIFIARRPAADDVYLLTQGPSRRETPDGPVRVEPSYEFRFCAACEPLPLMTDRDGVRGRLAVALDAAVAFALQTSLSGWDKKFADARRAIDAIPESGLAHQLFDGALTAESLSLLDAAWRGDISGGIGSWNDLEPSNGYDRVTSALSSALGDAVEAAINAS